jgi:putative flippase GtrA
MLHKKQITQFAEYQLGGMLFFASAWVIITFGEPKIGLWWANILGNAVGITLNYLVQRYLTFGKTPSSTQKTSWRFVVLTGLNLVTSYFVLKGLVSVGVKLWFAQCLSAGFFTLWNWTWYKLWVFKP